MQMQFEALSRAASEARGLAMDAVQASQSGHLGLPLGCAEIGAVLYGYLLRHNPDQPRWINRDYFILSAGHGSMFLYAWLHLSGYDVSIEDIKRFRQLHSKTPGHPEYFETPGVECTTGPLGQGVGNAVGVAMAAKMAEAHFNTSEHRIFDQHVFCLAGDGCLQEGVSSEASAFAAHFGLDNLILIYDSNAITLDAMAKQTQSEDTRKRYEAYGFNTQEIQGDDMQEFLDACNIAKERDNGKPQFIIIHTLAGKGIPEIEGTAKAHGEAGAKFVDAARKNLGLPEEHYFVSKETRGYFTEHKKKLLADFAQWEKTWKGWREKNPEKARALDNAIDKKVPQDLLEKIPPFPTDAKLATRKAGGEVLQPIAKAMPNLISGSADLYGSTMNYIKESGDFTRDNPGGRNIRFGIREHGMCAILNGVSYHGVFRASGATLLSLTRQNVPMLNEIDVKLRREGVRRGGYIAKQESAALDLIILSCGSELQHALAAAKELGAGTRVVSMPCMERFNREAEEYREEVLPKECRKRVAIEAGVPEIWYQYVGLDGKVIGLHRFGLSAPGAEVMKEFGIDAQHVVDAARSLS